MEEEKKKRLPAVTQEWAKENINDESYELMFDFLSQQQLSDQTLKQYRSALFQFLKWTHDNCKNKSIIELKKREIRKYFDYLASFGLTKNSVAFKKSAVSSFYNFIEEYYEEDFDNVRNLTKGIANAGAPSTKKKIVIKDDELTLLYNTLEEKEEWQLLALAKTLFGTGGRRAEIIQLKKHETLKDIERDDEGNPLGFYYSDEVRKKGRGKTGKIGQLMISEDAMISIKKWLEVRGEDDCEYIFVIRDHRGVRPLRANTVNDWVDSFSEILGRKINPHLFRSSVATSMVVNEKVDINLVAEMLDHNDISTTDKFYVIKERDKSAYKSMFKKKTE